MKCLVVDDDAAARMLIQHCVSGLFDNIEFAADGREAVAAFEMALDEGVPFDLVCLDIMMPKMDGREALQAIRDMEEQRGKGLAGVKIIMTTALGDSKTVLGTFRAGCEGYVVKPLDKHKLLDEIEKLGFAPAQVD